MSDTVILTGGVPPVIIGPTTMHSEPFLAPGTLSDTPLPEAVDWMRAPACPNNATDCRITITRMPVTTPPPSPITDGLGTGQPALVLKAIAHGDCSVCKLSWDITRSPPTTSTFVPVEPPVYPPI
jgi:hypothetical protein